MFFHCMFINEFIEYSTQNHLLQNINPLITQHKMMIMDQDERIRKIYKVNHFITNKLVIMNLRDTFSSSKYNPKPKPTKQPVKLQRRLQTQINQPTTSYKPNQFFDPPTHRIQTHKQSNKPKYLEVYSKIQPKQSLTRKTFKVHTTKPFVLNKYVRTEADQQNFIVNQSHQIHRRKISEIGTPNNMKTISPAEKYEIDGVAGKGTFGTVFYGHVRGTGKKIAIKKVLQDKRYKNRQLQILKTLKHPNLLQMKDHYMTQQGDEQYLNVVMDYFPQNLYQGIKKKPMNPALIKIYIYQILRGLMFMNFSSIAHRDMKPHNVLINRETNKVVVCDFGSAKQLVKGQSNLAYICSRCYRAPELIFGATNYSSQIDIWSTGCILVEMINGEPPFLGDSQIEQLIEIIKIMGTPSKQQVTDMNPQYNMAELSKFPTIKKTQWKNVLKTKDPLLVDLVHNIMQYSPKRRFTAEDALKHKYFDELRFEDTYKDLYSKVKVIPELFDFLPQELQMIKNPQLLIPKWVETNHTSHLNHKQYDIEQLEHFHIEIQQTAFWGFRHCLKDHDQFFSPISSVNKWALEQETSVKSIRKEIGLIYDKQRY